MDGHLFMEYATCNDWLLCLTNQIRPYDRFYFARSKKKKKKEKIKHKTRTKPGLFEKTRRAGFEELCISFVRFVAGPEKLSSYQPSR